MPRHLLSALKVKNAKPLPDDAPRPYRLADGDNLFLYVPPSGVKAWQFRYRWQGKQMTMTLGKADVVSLGDARDRAEDARKTLERGENPMLAKRVAHAKRRAQAANTFHAVAADWMRSEGRRLQWAATYRDEVANSLANHLNALDALPLSDIRANLVAPIIRKVERTAPYMVEKITRRLRAILDYGVEQGIIEINPLPQTRRRRRAERRHYPAILDRAGVGEILRNADKADACRGVKRAHYLLTFCVQRISEVVDAKWAEFDLERGIWSIPRGRMKRKDAARGAHAIPLPPRLIATLREWKRVDGDDAIYVCPAPRDATKPIVVEAPEKFYRNTLALAGKHSPHSWRSVFSTWGHDAGKDSDVIEAQLDHVTGNATKVSYDRAKRVELRRDLLRWYEDQLYAARDGADVIPIRVSA